MQKRNNDEECFRGYICNINSCKKCHYSCSKCSLEDSKNSCTKCSPLTIDEEPKSGQCPINYIDITQFEDFSVKIYPKGDEFN